MGRELPDAKSGDSSADPQTRAMPDANTWANYEEPKLPYEGINKTLNVMTDTVVEQG